MDIDLRELIVLSSIPGIGANRLRALVQHFGGTREIFKAPGRELVTVDGIERRTASVILQFLRSEEFLQSQRHAAHQLTRLGKANGRIITFWDQEFPANLKRIYDPPAFLYTRGTLSAEDESSIAIVGTRSPSRYGTSLAQRFADALAKQGIPVISGLARGIDTTAHRSTLDSGGRTIAVIGSGIDLIYPPENVPLADRIATNGAVVSEFKMGAKPDAVNFPRRNRIISGISLGTLVIETGIEGGAMITAATALDQNREVFAVPGPVDSQKRSGTHLLIKEGRATLVEGIEDILVELTPRFKHLSLVKTRVSRQSPPADLTLFEQQVYLVLGNEPLHIDSLALSAGIPTADALVQLLSLELKGIVRQLPGKHFVRV